MTTIVLVGHGAPPTDAPQQLVATLKRLEGERRRKKEPASAEELRLDAQVRGWPRTAENDPYRVGVESLATALRAALPATPVVTAYNEFCAPSIADAVRALVKDGMHDIVVVPTMLTRGGVHSEVEIPEELAALRAELGSTVTLTYAWPFDEAALATLLASRIQAALGR